MGSGRGLGKLMNDAHPIVSALGADETRLTAGAPCTTRETWAPLCTNGPVRNETTSIGNTTAGPRCRRLTRHRAPVRSGVSRQGRHEGRMVPDRAEF
jgi:hypothetical protein